MISQKKTPSITEMWTIIRQQQLEIQQLQSQLGPGAAPLPEPRSLPADRDTDPDRITRRSLLRRALVGAGGLVGLTALFSDTETAGANSQTSFVSSGFHPTVGTMNKGNGPALAAQSSGNSPTAEIHHHTNPDTGQQGSEIALDMNSATTGINSSTRGAALYAVMTGGDPNGCIFVKAMASRANGIVSQAADTSVTAYGGTTGVFAHGPTGVQGVGTAYGVYGSCPVSPSQTTYGVYADGNLGASGAKTAVVPFSDGKLRSFYGLECPECWFEDFGSASLHAGSVTVRLDPRFAESIKPDSYHVFVTARGSTRGLYVAAQNADSFVVAEQNAGKSSEPFSYRVVGLRRDIDAPRLAEVDLPVPPERYPPR